MRLLKCAHCGFFCNECAFITSLCLQVKKTEDSAPGEEEERTVSVISSLLQNIAKQVTLMLFCLHAHN
jgi:hypothetical protein